MTAALAAPSLAFARPAPVTWCGTDEAVQDRVPDLEASASQQVRFVYAIPSDAADNFAAVASGIATDAQWIDQWWQAQDPTRAPRFDRYAFPGCTSKFGQLDIGFMRLSQPSSAFSSQSEPGPALDAAFRGFFRDKQKTIVYFDGPIADHRLCGETGFLADTTGGDTGSVFIFLQSCSLGLPGSGMTAEVATHELTHNLGAVPSGAPHECPDNEGHVCDTPSDLMYPFLTPGSTLDSEFLDFGHDDYYAHGGSQWDVQDSAWLEHLPQLPFTATVVGSGTLNAHTGTVTQVPVNLSCDTGCNALALDTGTHVSIQATPKPGWRFSSWSGACSGTADICELDVTAATTAVATFAKVSARVTVVITGRGRVTSSPAGIACPGACQKSFTSFPLRLVAKPARGSTFVGWSGACHGRGVCTLTGAAAVGARFRKG